MTAAALLAALAEIAERAETKEPSAVTCYHIFNIARRALREHAEVDNLSEPLVVTITLDDAGRCVAVTRTNSEGQIKSVIWEAPTRAPLSGSRVGTLVEIVRGMIASAEWTSDIQGLHIPTRTLDALREAVTAPPEHAPEPVAWPCVYVASRASISARSQMWRDFRASGHRISATWIDEAGEDETADFSELWQRIANEIERSCGVILYAETGDFPLKGALIECGIALGMGKHVAVVLPGVELETRTNKPIGSWIDHPSVLGYGSIEAAYRALLEIEHRAAAPLPSARRPVTPCTREEAVEVAKHAEVITPDIENAAVQGSKHFWVVRVIELMRLIDAARGVKSDG